MDGRLAGYPLELSWQAADNSCKGTFPEGVCPHTLTAGAGRIAEFVHMDDSHQQKPVPPCVALSVYWESQISSNYQDH